MSTIPSSLVRRSNQPYLLNQDCQVTPQSLLNLGIQMEMSKLPIQNTEISRTQSPTHKGPSGSCTYET
jgi:hypothetical protein